MIIPISPRGNKAFHKKDAKYPYFPRKNTAFHKKDAKHPDFSLGKIRLYIRHMLNHCIFPRNNKAFHEKDVKFIARGL